MTEIAKEKGCNLDEAKKSRVEYSKEIYEKNCVIVNDLHYLLVNI